MFTKAVQWKWTLTNFNTGEAESGDETQNEEHEPADIMSVAGDTARATSASQNLPPIRRPVKRNANTFEEEVFRHFKPGRPNEKDDDELFLLSLLPMFKKLDDPRKLWARMKFMETILQAITFGIPMPSPTISDTSNIPAHPHSLITVLHIPHSIILLLLTTHQAIILQISN
ncbi:unnamed protein product [Ceutorhynchus assimilis]|uniref:BESS domain-containing protein n=1 Tax=Ceutorhynchus assimilis TaxID=467358 RepID=A0A9N9MA83_9CUCU|nr:unnamed protein product [Ceutorhynchus assimilis]